MDEHDGIVVDIDDAGIGRDSLGDLMRVVRRGDARTGVEELPDPGLAGQVPGRPGQELPVRLDPEPQAGSDREHPLGCFPVGGEVVLAA